MWILDRMTPSHPSIYLPPVSEIPSRITGISETEGSHGCIVSCIDNWPQSHCSKAEDLVKNGLPIAALPLRDSNKEASFHWPLLKMESMLRVCSRGNSRVMNWGYAPGLVVTR